MSKIFLLVIVVAVVALGGHIEASKFSFDGYRLIRVTPQNENHIELLAGFEGTSDFDIWNAIQKVGAPVDVALSPSAFFKYSSIFKMQNMPFEVVNENIQDIFDEQERSMADNSRNTNIIGKYASHAEINSYLDTLAATDPSIASTYIAGRSYESRNLKVLVLRTAERKRKIWLDCGIHAREWLSHSTCVWIIDSLVTRFKNGEQTATTLLNTFEFHILPVVNPDGYEYSRSTYRMWRKNRARTPNSCIGVDLNRNWGYKWSTGGSSNRPCDDTYAGPRQDSELETQAIQGALRAHIGQWDAYITIHSYGNWWFLPFGFTRDTNGMPNYKDMLDKAEIGVNAYKAVNRQPMTFGPSSHILYIASGGSEDWAYAVAGAKYAYCLELRPSQSGADSNYGFALPQDRTSLAGTETYAGLTAFLSKIV